MGALKIIALAESRQSLSAVRSAYTAAGYRLWCHCPPDPRKLVRGQLPEVDLVLLLEGAWGLSSGEVSRQLHQAGLQIPLLCLSAAYTEAAAGEAISSGAADCLPLQDLGRLVAVTRRILREQRHQQRQAPAEPPALRLHPQLLAARDAERHRLAREFHDAIGHELIVLQMSAQSAAAHLGQEPLSQSEQRLVEIERLTMRLAGEVRRICHDLYPPTLEMLGLGPAVEQLVEPLGKSVELQVRIGPSLAGVRFAAEAEISIYRIIQEGLQNMLKHSRANRAVLALDWHDGQLELSLVDDGCGFDVAAASGGLGLLTMQARAQALGGRLELHSQPGRTALVVRVDLTPRRIPEEG